MLRLGKCPAPLRAALCRTALGQQTAGFSSTAVSASHQPNAPLDLDPSFHALLKDVDMSLLRQKARHSSAHNPHAKTHRELEIYPNDSSAEPESLDLVEHEYDYESEELSNLKEDRKSPAASFGSQRIGAIVLPSELQGTIDRLIMDSDKHALRQDATRLFSRDSEDGNNWDPSYKARYKSMKQAARHAQRDGTAFASVALPSHYSAIYAVLDHVKQRLGPDWSAKRVIDWGCGTGTGLWALSHSFQKHDDVDRFNTKLSQSTVSDYMGIENREGLLRIGKRLIRDIDTGGLNISWWHSLTEADGTVQPPGEGVLALSAFLLSSLSDGLARKNLVKKMWESGADVIILIDHSSSAGFECIAEAREFLLRLGKKETDGLDPTTSQSGGCHVVAPCPHDGTCPLYKTGSSKLICGFSQRLQRPAFVRKTKHSGVGHEDTGYSYVVIRRGSRPSHAQSTLKVGRIGYVGRRELDKLSLQQAPITELVVEEEHSAPLDSVAPTASDSQGAAAVETSSHIEVNGQEDIQAALRLEAYSWPRLVFPPLKRSGHVILDGCTAEGKIMRMTIPKSQGKQPYYDARKSSWGDIFPHEPKNAPQERYSASSQSTGSNGDDIGKRKNLRRDAASYTRLSNELQEQKAQRRSRERRTKIRLPDDWDPINE